MIDEGLPSTPNAPRYRKQDAVRINYITNIRLSQSSGGFSGMNKAAWDIISESANAQYTGPINPPTFLTERLLYKFTKLTRLPRNFFFFSDARLNHISALVERELATSESDLIFFHGFTPWIRIRPQIRYIAWSDCTFSQYITIFHERSDFNSSDIARIIRDEEAWLKDATAVWFRNHYAAKGAIKEYGLDPQKVKVVGNCGLVPPPKKDEYQGSQDLLFISTDFKKKGGYYLLQAMERIILNYPIDVCAGNATLAEW